MERLSVLYNHVYSSILELSSEKSIVLQLNRPNQLNCLSYEMIQKLIFHLSNTKNSKKPVLITGVHKISFSVGGDLKFLLSNCLSIPEYLRSLHHMFYLNFLSNSISL